MVKIQRLESMLVSDGGGTIGEAIRVCTRRIEQQQASLDDVRSRLRTQRTRGMVWRQLWEYLWSGQPTPGQKKKKKGCSIPRSFPESDAIFSYFGPRARFSIFGPIFSHFWISARFPFCTRRPDSQAKFGLFHQSLDICGLFSSCIEGKTQALRTKPQRHLAITQTLRTRFPNHFLSLLCAYAKLFSGLQTYPNLHPLPRVGPPLGCLPRGSANLCRFVPV